MIIAIILFLVNIITGQEQDCPVCPIAIPLSEFTDYVDDMHTDGNARFEEEFDVSYIISRPSHSIRLIFINQCFCSLSL